MFGDGEGCLLGVQGEPVKKHRCGQGLKIILGDRVGRQDVPTDKRSGRKAAELRNAWVEANYRRSKGRNVESHLGAGHTWLSKELTRISKQRPVNGQSKHRRQCNEWCSPWLFFLQQWKVTSICLSVKYYTWTLTFSHNKTSPTGTKCKRLQTCADHNGGSIRSHTIWIQFSKHPNCLWRLCIQEMRGREMTQIDKV